MGEIKSSREIAMEKVDRLKELTPEELKKQQEQKYIPIGKALADKYLRALTLRQLEIEMGKYSDKDRELLNSIVALSLFQSIELGDYERLEKVVSAMLHLKQKELPEETVEEIKNLFREYITVKNKDREKTEASVASVLSEFGISGSAIAEAQIVPDVESPQLPGRITQSFIDRLERLKQKLLEQSA